MDWIKADGSVVQVTSLMLPDEVRAAAVEVSRLREAYARLIEQRAEAHERFRKIRELSDVNFSSYRAIVRVIAGEGMVETE